MKIAISVSAPEDGASFNMHFGRAPAFAIVDTDTGERQVIPNPAAQLSGGAGIRAAELLARQGVQTVISGSFGPKAYDVLHDSDMQLYQAKSGTVEELVTRLLQGDLEAVKAAQ